MAIQQKRGQVVAAASERILEIWRDPDSIPSGSDFCAENGRGAGRWIPCYAEVVFDGATWPKLDRAWPPVVKKIWDSINDYLGRGAK